MKDAVIGFQLFIVLLMFHTWEASRGLRGLFFMFELQHKSAQRQCWMLLEVTILPSN